MRKKLISFAVFFAIMVTYFGFISIGNVSAADIDTDEYSKMAVAFLEGIGEDGFATESTEMVYTLDESIYGCKVNIFNYQSGKKGYIIFSSNNGVVEFSTDSEGSAFDEYKGSKLYYNGTMEYYFKKSEKLISIKDKKEKKLNEIKVNRVNRISEDYGFHYGRKNNDYKAEKNGTADSLSALDGNLIAAVGAGQIITSPEALLTQIYSVETKTIPNFDFCYTTETSFPEYRNNCGPVAALNLIIWYDNNGYSNLITSSMPYTITYVQITNYMNFRNQFSTVFEVHDGIYNYFKFKYPNSSQKGYTDIYITHSDIFGRVGQNIPSIYGVTNHSLYGEQFVLLVGYKKITTYWFNIFGWKCYTDHVFLRVADGWTGYANRYINFDDATLRTMAWIA